MIAKQPDPMRLRIADAKQRLDDAIRTGAPAGNVEAIVKELELLKSLAGARLRRRATRWIAAIAAAALLLAIPLHLWLHLRSADFVLVASTNAFTIQNGSARTNLIPDGAPVKEIVVSSRVWRNVAANATALPTDVSDLVLTSAFLNADSSARIRANGPCFEFTVLRGGGSVNVSWRKPDTDFDTVDLRANDTLRFCPTLVPLVRSQNLTAITIADRTTGGLAEREDLPALLQGTLTVVNTAEVFDLRRTDVPRAGELSRPTLIARLREPIEISVVGIAGRLSVTTGTNQQSRMPSWLDVLRRSPELKTALAVIGAIIAAAIAAREHLPSEV